ncbi:phytochelatin synthase family protein [Kovacikia minuta CCNUW1]|uniref:phytochelatin synthase family protein n=1 Tax=Kovacikia minuta TaxID=2931930 RepID=UPI001CCC7959|nr:phytochelatin synthase family protein [Kovacikia minuta]UBF23826.1 phytochelatin synthase family protein [Kovacikia minuta CCNUW1]
MVFRGIGSLRFLLRAAIVGLCLSGGNALTQTLPLPSNLINFNSREGSQLLLESNAREDYWPLSIQFVTQNSQSFCGVASMVMVLNSLAIPAPQDPRYSPYRVFTQEDFFNNEQTRKVLSPDIVMRQGMTLDQLGQLLATHPVDVQVHHAGDLTINEFRQRVVENLQQPNNFVLANYLRKAIGEEKGGHISPIAAYNQQTDRFLILDVSRYKYPPVWVKATELWQAMLAVDSVSGKTRGFVLVKRKE